MVTPTEFTQLTMTDDRVRNYSEYLHSNRPPSPKAPGGWGWFFGGLLTGGLLWVVWAVVVVVWSMTTGRSERKRQNDYDREALILMEKLVTTLYGEGRDR